MKMKKLSDAESLAVLCELDSYTAQSRMQIYDHLNISPRTALLCSALATRINGKQVQDIWKNNMTQIDPTAQRIYAALLKNAGTQATDLINNVLILNNLIPPVSRLDSSLAGYDPEEVLDALLDSDPELEEE